MCGWGIANSTLFGSESLDAAYLEPLSRMLLYSHVDLLHGDLFLAAPRTSKPTPVGYLPAEGMVVDGTWVVMGGVVGEEEKPQVAELAIPLSWRSPVVPWSRTRRSGPLLQD